MTTSTVHADFKERVAVWANRLNTKVCHVSIRPMTTKWASCSTAGNLTFAADLLALDRDLWDYVIVHELLHVSVPNHGRLWQALMRAHLGNHEAVAVRLAAAASIRPLRHR